MSSKSEEEDLAPKAGSSAKREDLDFEGEPLFLDISASSSGDEPKRDIGDGGGR